MPKSWTVPEEHLLPSDAEEQVSGRPPLVTVGLPVYNGQNYLESALDGLLAQTFTDFELIISDNASTDRTERICREYAARDPRIRYFRRPRNVGVVLNHNALVPVARGRYFKWAGHDDVYEPDLLARCVEGLEADPSAVLANVWDGVVDDCGRRTALPYRLRTEDSAAHVRFRSVLREDGGNDFYGMFRTDVIRRMRPQGTYLHMDRVLVAEASLMGRFHEIPDVLYYRRDHPERASRAPSAREVLRKLDPVRGDRLRHPLVRVYAEYVLGLVGAVLHAPLPWRERARCLQELASFLSTRVRPSVARQVVTGTAPPAEVPVIAERGP
jgi:glycosyltransferase involved in cell wall biosynthesis